MADIETPTPFQEVYDIFLSKITDDMFMELTMEDTEAMLQEILLQAIPMFEQPRFDIFDIDLANHQFNSHLNFEEENIIATYMVATWVGFQLASVENVRQKYSGSDFSFTSQASHMGKLQEMKEHYTDEGFHLQRVYDRRRLTENWDKRPGYVSNFTRIMESDREW